MNRHEARKARKLRMKLSRMDAINYCVKVVNEESFVFQSLDKDLNPLEDNLNSKGQTKKQYAFSELKENNTDPFFDCMIETMENYHIARKRSFDMGMLHE